MTACSNSSQLFFYMPAAPNGMVSPLAMNCDSSTRRPLSSMGQNFRSSTSGHDPLEAVGGAASRGVSPGLHSNGTAYFVALPRPPSKGSATLLFACLHRCAHVDASRFLLRGKPFILFDMIDSLIKLGQNLFGRFAAKKAWDRQNEYNLPINQVRRLRNANLSPAFHYDGAGNVAGPINLPSVQAITPQADRNEHMKAQQELDFNASDENRKGRAFEIEMAHSDVTRRIQELAMIKSEHELDEWLKDSDRRNREKDYKTNRLFYGSQIEQLNHEILKASKEAIKVLKTEIPGLNVKLLNRKIELLDEDIKWQRFLIETQHDIVDPTAPLGERIPQALVQELLRGIKPDMSQEELQRVLYKAFAGLGVFKLFGF